MRKPACKLKGGTLAEACTENLQDINNNMEYDNVTKPKHYCTHPSGVECIEITREMGFAIGSAFKYLYRCDKKENLTQDIQKAVWYIEDEIKRREGFRWKFMRENPFYLPQQDGPTTIKAVLTWESRFSGHLQWALDRLYTAHALPRSVEPLKSALETLNHILKIWG